MATFNEVAGLILAVSVIGVAASLAAFLALLRRMRATDREYARTVAEVREAVGVLIRYYGGTV